MEEIILAEIRENINSPYAVSKLDHESIKYNIDEIIKFIKNDDEMKIFKDKEIYLIRLRLGLLGDDKPLNFYEICTKSTALNVIRRTYSLCYINANDFLEMSYELRKKFCIYIRRINNTIIRKKLEDGMKTLSSRKHSVDIDSLKNENKELCDENKYLKEEIELLKEQNIDIFMENVLLKVKKYIG